jgi:hypothetical protein
METATSSAAAAPPRRPEWVEPLTKLGEPARASRARCNLSRLMHTDVADPLATSTETRQIK